MTSKGVSLLKFVGTVSLGLLTGLSYSLTTISVPSILALPSAASAASAFHNLIATSTIRLRVLTGLSATSFLLAFFFSPRSHRHPYLLYTSILALASGLLDRITPFLDRCAASTDSNASIQLSSARLQARKDRIAAQNASRAARMEMSYEVLGDTHSEGTGSASGGDDPEVDQEQLNGEEVRDEVESFSRRALVQTGIASVGFLMAVVGIWGDGAVQVFQSETIVFQA